MTNSNLKKKSADIAPLVLNVLKSKGLALPDSIDEIEAAETEIDEGEYPLPPRLSVPWGFLEGDVQLRFDASKFSPKVSKEIVEEFARAARSGGELTEEIKERMKKDRESAEATDDEKKK